MNKVNKKMREIGSLIEKQYFCVDYLWDCNHNSIIIITFYNQQMRWFGFASTVNTEITFGFIDSNFKKQKILSTSKISHKLINDIIKYFTCDTIIDQAAIHPFSFSTSEAYYKWINDNKYICETQHARLTVSQNFDEYITNTHYSRN